MSVQVHMHVNRRSELDYRLYLYTMCMLLSALCILHCWILTTTIININHMNWQHTHNFKQSSQLQQQGVRISNTLVTINCNCCVAISLLVVAVICRWGNKKSALHHTSCWYLFSLLTSNSFTHSQTNKWNPVRQQSRQSQRQAQGGLDQNPPIGSAIFHHCLGVILTSCTQGVRILSNSLLYLRNKI